MRLRGFHLRDAEANIQDINLEFKEDDGSILNNVCVFGRNGSGKTYMLGCIARAWSACVLSKASAELPYVAKMLRIDFEVNNEIVSLHMRNGIVEKSSTLVKNAEVFVGDEAKVRHGIVYYASGRGSVSRSTVRSGTQLSDSVSVTFPVVYDLHMRDVTDSIVMIDDWDLGLDAESSRNFYSHLVKHTLSKGNQLVLSSSIFPAKYVSGVREISGRQDPVQESSVLLGKVRG